MENNPTLISFVIPVYNNANSLELLHSRLEEILRKFPALTSEWVYVNDGSQDSSEDVLLHMRQTNKQVKLLTFTRNFGQVAAIQAGIEYAKGDGVVVMSADMQEPAELVTAMLEKWQAGAQLVLAFRAGRNDGFLNHGLSRVFYSLIRFSNPEIPPGGFDYCLLDRTVATFLRSVKHKNRFLQGDLLYPGFKTALIPYERTKGVPRIGKRRPIRNLTFKVKYFIDGILNTTTYPIRLISLLGILTIFLGILYSGVIVLEWFRGETPFRGWAPIMISILLIGGLILFTLGILGEYIWRIYDELRGFPPYVIRERYLDDE